MRVRRSTYVPFVWLPRKLIKFLPTHKKEVYAWLWWVWEFNSLATVLTFISAIEGLWIWFVIWKFDTKAAIICLAVYFLLVSPLYLMYFRDEEEDIH